MSGERRIGAARVLLFLVVALLVRQLAADERCVPVMTFSFMPGDSREITHSDSAAKDTALIAYEVAPRVSVTTGGEFAFFLFRFAPLSLRVGMFGMFELSTLKPDRANFLTVPSGPYLWRGLLGYGMALSLDRLARQLLGLGGALELGAGFRHESEHVTYTSSYDVARFDGAPHIGDVILLDIAFRKAVGAWLFKGRVQNKFFLPTYDNYTMGPGGDAGVQWWVHPYVHPFLSVFGEYLFGKRTTSRQVPDNRMIRLLAGVVFPGEVADVQIYFSYAYGNDKGVLALEKGHRYGFGIRVSFFKNRD
jgi:hypothetical protein